ncbi:MAG: hypothetical protein ACFB4J_03525 [Elainellaceae cyanobacterium]
MNNFAGINQKARRLILDYALGAAILALFPIPRVRVLKAIALLVLHYKLLRGVRQIWGKGRGGDLLAWFGVLAGLAGAIALGFMGWIGTIALGALVPNIDALAPGAAFFCYFWSIGQVVNHFYLSGLGQSGAETTGANPLSKAQQDET